MGHLMCSVLVRDVGLDVFIVAAAAAIVVVWSFFAFACLSCPAFMSGWLDGFDEFSIWLVGLFTSDWLLLDGLVEFTSYSQLPASMSRWLDWLDEFLLDTAGRLLRVRLAGRGSTSSYGRLPAFMSRWPDGVRRVLLHTAGRLLRVTLAGWICRVTSCGCSAASCQVGWTGSTSSLCGWLSVFGRLDGWQACALARST